jgi:hypothetical protein
VRPLTRVLVPNDPALDITGFAKGPSELSDTDGIVFRRSWTQKADHRYRRLLRARRHQPGKGRTDDLCAVAVGEFGSRSFHELGFCIDLLGTAEPIDNTSKMKANCVTGVGIGISDGFSFQQRSHECVDRSDVRLGRALANRHGHARARENDIAAGSYLFLFDKPLDGRFFG